METEERGYVKGKRIIIEQLRKVQNELKAPKDQKNTFGGFNYRSAEDILEAVKPICLANGLTVILNDTIEVVGNRYYIKAFASVMNDLGDTITSSALAREPEEKKGMDASQITGTSSSYARKYAMNGLFAIDDTKDADTNEHKTQTTEKTMTKGISADPLETSKKLIEKTTSATTLKELKDKMLASAKLTQAQKNQLTKLMDKRMEEINPIPPQAREDEGMPVPPEDNIIQYEEETQNA